MRIFIYSGNETRGPYTIADAQRLLDAGIISLTDLASYNRGGVRVPLSSVLGLSDATSTRPTNVHASEGQSSQAPSRATRIFIHRGTRTFGPYGMEDVLHELSNGSLKPTDMATYDGGGDTPVPLETVPGVVNQQYAQEYGSDSVPNGHRRLATFNAWMSNIHGWIIAIALFVFLGISIYRNIQVSRGRYDKIHDGMTKAEVRAILGNPTDVTEVTLAGMRADQWVYTAATSSTSKVILIDFENGRVTDKTWGGSHY